MLAGDFSERQQFIDFAVRPGGEFFQGVFQPRRRIKAVEFSGAEQTLDGGSTFTGSFGADKEVIFPADSNWPYRVLAGIVIDRQVTGVGVADERWPAL